MIVCWAAKGGSGTTVVACALGLGFGSRSQPATLVDLSGDCATALGMDEPTGPGVVDWLASPTAGPTDLVRLAVPSPRRGCNSIPRGTAGPRPTTNGRGSPFGAQRFANVIIDAGTGHPPQALHDAAEQSLLVTRPCFIAIRRAQHLAIRPTGIVLGRRTRAGHLTSRDVEHALGVPVAAEVRLDPAVARAVDAGLLIARLPKSLIISLRRAA